MALQTVLNYLKFKPTTLWLRCTEKLKETILSAKPFFERLHTVQKETFLSHQVVRQTTFESSHDCYHPIGTQGEM